MHRRELISSLVLLVLVELNWISGFNISPKPNIVFKEPELKAGQPKVRSSYFGFAINLRERSVIVGAPRAQSSLEPQRRVNETGAIYKCSFQTGQCAPYVFDAIGNVYIERSDYTYDSVRKDLQWLGAAIDGGSKDTDRLVVCAPRLVADARTEYLAHGICYWTPNTLGSSPTAVEQIKPLRLKDKQLKVVNGKRVYYYSYAQMGMSVHITDNNEEILIGAPGIYTWKGSVIRYRRQLEEDFGGLSRRSYDNLAEHKIVPRQTFEYTTDIPDPDTWGQQNDSYFGYAVTSGHFNSHEPHKIYYVASAPQANLQSGEAYLFSFTSKSIDIHRTFSGQQFGEYFGYSLLSDDFNGDKLPDLAISAPLHSINGYPENGVVYIFLNKGDNNFELANILKSGKTSPGRFGITLSKLGDIDHDGYNDIAIGAPFEGNGAVYIFLGGSNGFHEKPSQIIKSPDESSAIQSMFGHGISKGVDIDSNGHHDLAIGAPNAELMYLYKTYPVVRINAYTQSLTRSISIDQTKFQFRACWSLESSSNRTVRQPIRITLKIDPHVKRAFFAENINEMEFEAIAEELPTCKIYDAMVKFSLPDIFKPIDIEIHYNLIKTIPDSEVFCDTCAAINPRLPKFSTERITFSTGCRDVICVSDLQVSSSGFGKSFILGSSRTQVVTYKVRNNGETSYLTELNITAPAQMPFARIPSSCTLQENSLRCTLFKGRPLPNGAEDTLAITFDTSKLAGDRVTIKAEAFNTGNELKASDNVVVDVVLLREYSEIEMSYRQLTPPISLENDHGMKEIKNLIEIRNNGPSSIKRLKVLIYIPISYRVPEKQNRILLVEYSNITITGSHNNKTLNPVFTQNNTVIIQNAIESSSTVSQIVDNMQGMDFDSSKVGYPIEYDQGIPQDTFDTDLTSSRRRRSAEAYIANVEYDRLTQWDKKVLDIRESLSSLLPLNRTVLFNCHNPAEALCIEASLDISNLVPGDTGVSLSINYNIDLDQIDKILTENKDFFVITTIIDVIKMDDEEGHTVKVLKAYPHNIISKYQMAVIPLWVYIVSAIAGILILVMMTYGFYKMGFFKREKKEELEKLHRRSQREDDESEQRLT